MKRELSVTRRSIFMGFTFVILTLTTNAGGFIAIQRSVYNDRTADLALDGKSNTCAETGIDSGAWWKTDLETSRRVSGITIIGSSDAFQVRVGNLSDTIGDRAGSSMNILCYQSLGIDDSLPPLPSKVHDIQCTSAIYGRFVSIEVVDPVSVRRLRLCEVHVQFG